MLLINPEKEYAKRQKESPETAVADYFKLLILVGLVGAIFNFLFGILRAAYYDIFLRVDVKYLRLVNYLGGISFSTILSPACHVKPSATL